MHPYATQCDSLRCFDLPAAREKGESVSAPVGITFCITFGIAFYFPPTVTLGTRFHVVRALEQRVVPPHGNMDRVANPRPRPHTTQSELIHQQTAEAETRKGKQRAKRQWDEESFLNDLRQRRGDVEVTIASNILDWANAAEHPLSLLWGNGHTDGTVTMRLDDERGKQYVCTLASNGKLGVPFGWMKSTLPYSDKDLRMEFLNKINQVNGVAWGAESIEKWPNLDFAILKNSSSLNQLLEALDWATQQIVSSRDV